MSYHFIEKKDPHVEVLFQGLGNLERMLSDMEKAPKPVFKGERFLTDEELSGILRISRRTLQEYRTFGVIPYYLLQGKVLYGKSTACCPRVPNAADPRGHLIIAPFAQNKNNPCQQ